MSVDVGRKGEMSDRSEVDISGKPHKMNGFLYHGLHKRGSSCIGACPKL